MTVPDKTRVTPHMARKGRRLHREGKIRYLPGARTYTVQGDHDLYLVTIAGDLATCSCAAIGTCSHIQGVRIARHANKRSARNIEIGAQS